MTHKFRFDDLFVFEMANNHQGSVEHGLRIIVAMGELMRKHKVRAAIKFQFRELETFVHPAHRAGSTNKHVPRFLSTKLSETDFAQMVTVAKREGLLVMTTPFDEPSVDVAKRLGVDILKVASCSGKDYPLLREIAAAGLPVLASNGGLTKLETGLLVEVFDSAGVPFALQHCVAKYPTQSNELQLSEITRLKKWFPHLVIGFSTHEKPDNTDAIKMAYAKGARTFEKHVGVQYGSIVLNAYSANPQQVDAWLRAWRIARDAEGSAERVIDETERTSLLELQRGVFAKRNIKAGETITRDDVNFEFPMQEGQCTSGEFAAGAFATCDYETDDPIWEMPVEKSHEQLLLEAEVQARMLINEAGAVLPREFVWEFSHHYGMPEYATTGLTMVEMLNHEYCHKLLVVFPGQGNPHHFHRIKKETFRLIHGDLHVECGGKQMMLSPGDLFTVEREVEHHFRSDTGCVFEEISTTQLDNDSFYRDPTISQRPRESRKSKVPSQRR